MIELLKVILSLSFSGTILILLLFMCRPLYQDRLSKRWQYYIWLLVIARLLLPATPETSLTGNLFRQAGQQVEQSFGFSSAYIENNDDAEPISDQNETAAGTMDSQESMSGMTDTGNGADILPQSSTVTPEGTSAHRIPENTALALCIVWLVIALLLFMRKITVYQSFVKYVTAGSTPVDDITLLERFGQIMDANHVKGTVGLYANGLVSSPLLIGFIHARVVLPTTDISEDDFYYTVLHELTHYKRRDMFYKWLVQLTICLHWFNPFVYLMGHEINRVCELSCDERVIQALSDKSRKSYGDTLLNAIGTGGSYKDTLASVTLNESKELLKGRLNAIMKYHKLPKAVQMAAIFITGILIGGAAVLGAYAAPTPTSDSNAALTAQSEFDAASAVLSDSDVVNPLPDYTIEYEDGVYYILTSDATETDKPSSSVTNGYYHLVLVRKDEYYSFGSWTDSEMQQLVRHITPLCRTSLENGRMTQENMDIVIAAATEIQERYRSGDKVQENIGSENIDSGNDGSGILYNYTQSAYYQAPYIIELGYNLPSKAQSAYASTLITLSDRSTMPVFFSEETEEYLSDEAAVSAVTKLIERIAPTKSPSRPLTAPYIVSIAYIGETNLDILAEKYYDEEMLTYFSAIFLELGDKAQQEYLDLMFEDENISFFACCIGMLEETDMQRQKDIVDRYILKAYEKDMVNFFAVLAGMLDADARNSWVEKCKNDGRTNYWYILSDEDENIFDDGNFMDDDDSDEWNDKWDEFDEFENNAPAPNILNLTRITKQDVSTDLLNILDSCDSGKWYVITENDCRYIYYNGLPYTYAYEPRIDGSETGDQITLTITDIGLNSPLLRNKESASNYVLLSLSYTPADPDASYHLSITYNKTPVSYDTISLASVSAYPLQ